MLSLKGRQRFLCRTVLLFLFVFLLAACGGGDEGGSSAVDGATMPDACTLLTAADVETVLGSSVSSVGDVDEEGLFSTCTWIGNTSGARLSLNIWGSNAGDGWATEFVSAQAGADYNVAVEDLGDEAYANIGEDHSNYIWRVDDAFAVVFTSTTNEENEDLILELARKIDNGL